MDNKTNQDNFNQNSYNHQRQQYYQNNQNPNYAQNPSYTNNTQQVQNQMNNQAQQIAPQAQQYIQQQVIQQNPQQPAQTKVANEQKQTTEQPAMPKYEFNSEEKVIYQMKEEKAASPLLAFILVGLVIAIVFLLPVITDKLGTIKLLNFQATKSNTQTSTTEEEEKAEKYKFYDIIATAKIGNIGINQLGISKSNEEYEMTFSIYNYSNEPYTFNKKYYINLYNDRDVLLYTALLYSFEPLAANSSREMSLIVPGKIYGEASHFDVEEFDVNRYKPYKLEGSDGEYQVLTCHYNYDEIKYYFRDNLLEKIYETHTESISSSNNYSSNKIKYESLSSQYRSIGLESHFEDKSNIGTFTMITEINYKTNPINDYDLNNLKQYKYFKYNTSSDIIAHEMPTIAYTCS